MGHYNMFGVLFYAILMSTTIDIVQSKYFYQPEIEGWVAQYKTIGTFDEAAQRCQSDGAVLMSPLHKELLDKMLSLINRNTPHYIGTRAKFHPSLFESFEGVLLDDMPLTDMYEQLDPQEGQCLSMTHDRVSVVPCSSRLPYMCYKKKTPELFREECGTFDEGYHLVNDTGHCYKFHSEFSSWPEAYFTCRSEGAYLAIADDEKEAQLIANACSNKTYYVSVGILDWKGNDGWKSIHGTPVQDIFNSWEDKTQHESEIAVINPDTGKLQALEADVLRPFICEKDPNTIMFS